MLNIIDKEQCCGCYACYNICPKNCIEMLSDDEGFWYPKINQHNCINCDLCKKVCPILTPNKNIISQKSAYAAINKNNYIRKQSSSGGIFSLLAEEILQLDGIVYGAAFDKDFNIEHKRISKLTDLKLLRGSKYVQSKINTIYSQVQNDLKNNALVLFSGTPCQIEGLVSFLQKDYDNLILMDIICHGVPSPFVWKKYLDFIKNKFHSNIKNISFRNKDLGWDNAYFIVSLKNNRTYSHKLYDDMFFQGFIKNLYLRPSCYNCKFKKINRISDITLADFWGIDNIHPEMNDNVGTSFIVVHSSKGNNIISKINDKMKIISTNINDGIKYNSCMITSVKQNNKRKQFFYEFQKNTKIKIDTLIFKYTKPKLKRYLRLKYKIKTLLNI